MLGWASQQFEKLSQTVAPPPADANGRFVYAVQKGDEDGAMAFVPEMDAARAVLNTTQRSYAIHLACQNSMDRLIRLLLTQPGVDLTFIDTHGNTPLHYATMSTDKARALSTIKMLVTEFKASVVAKNSMGQTPYDLASLDMVRQFLLPLQLQEETRQAIDNGGVGLPPGIDMGGLRIANPVAPPPPIMAIAPAPMSSPAPHAYPTPQHDPVKPPSSGQGDGYARVGGSSAAIFNRKGRNVVKADGFHSSSSDVNLQRKYGHTQTQYGSIAPPPSSGNAGASAFPPPGAANPFAGGNNPYASGRANQRYVAYDAVTGEKSSMPRGMGSPPATYGNPAATTAAPNFAVFQSGGAPAANALAAGQAPYGTQQPAYQANQPYHQSPAPQKAPGTPFQQQNQSYGQPQTQPVQQAHETPTQGGTPYGEQQQLQSPAPGYGAQSGAPGPSQQQGFSTPAKLDPNAAANLFSSQATGGSGTAGAPAETANGVFGSQPGSQPAEVASQASQAGVQGESNPEATASSAAAELALLPGWHEATDPTTGNSYYWHEGGTTSWERPVLQEEAPKESSSAPLDGPAAATAPSTEQEATAKTVVEASEPTFGASSSDSQPTEAASKPGAEQPAGTAFGAQPAPPQSASSVFGTGSHPLAVANQAAASDVFGAPSVYQPPDGVSQPSPENPPGERVPTEGGIQGAAAQSANNVFGSPPGGLPDQAQSAVGAFTTSQGIQPAGIVNEKSLKQPAGSSFTDQTPPSQSGACVFGAANQLVEGANQPTPRKSVSDLFGTPAASQPETVTGQAAPAAHADNAPVGAQPTPGQSAESLFGAPPGSQPAQFAAGGAFVATRPAPPGSPAAPGKIADSVFGAPPGTCADTSKSAFVAPPPGQTTQAQAASGFVGSPEGKSPGSIPLAPTSGGFSLADQAANLAAASDLFASPPSKGTCQNGAPAPRPVNNVAPPIEALPANAPAAEAFWAPAPPQTQSNAPGSPITPQAERAGSPSGSDECLDDVPLSPEGRPETEITLSQNSGPAATAAFPAPLVQQMQAPPGAAAAPGAASLFAAIGMPPPPFSSKT